MKKKTKNVKKKVNQMSLQELKERIEEMSKHKSSFYYKSLLSRLSELRK